MIPRSWCMVPPRSASTTIIRRSWNFQRTFFDRNECSFRRRWKGMHCRLLTPWLLVGYWIVLLTQFNNLSRKSDLETGGSIQMRGLGEKMYVITLYIAAGSHSISEDFRLYHRSAMPLRRQIFVLELTGTGFQQTIWGKSAQRSSHNHISRISQYLLSSSTKVKRCLWQAPKDMSPYSTRRKAVAFKRWNMVAVSKALLVALLSPLIVASVFRPNVDYCNSWFTSDDAGYPANRIHRLIFSLLGNVASLQREMEI